MNANAPPIRANALPTIERRDISSAMFEIGA
jgi:hypothetical protein